jgi:flavodoxin
VVAAEASGEHRIDDMFDHEGNISMRIAVMYESEFGNTRTLAEAIADELRREGAVQVTDLRAGPAALPHDLDLLVVGGPTQVHGISQLLRAELARWPQNALAGIAVAAFDTRVHGPHLLTGAASGGIARQLQQRGGRMVCPSASFLVDGREGPLTTGELERARGWARELLAQVATHAATK